jgi:hypothetical protein
MYKIREKMRLRVGMYESVVREYIGGWHICDESMMTISEREDELRERERERKGQKIPCLGAARGRDMKT